MSDILTTLCPSASAMAPRRKSDRLFPLPAGAVRPEGALYGAAVFIEKEQLLDASLWTLFEEQFSSGGVDDADHGWRCEYWGKMMRGACFVYARTMNPALYTQMEKTVRAMLLRQEADGRLSSYSREAEFHGWDLWGRKYVLLGMQYFYEICPSEQLKAEILYSMKRQADCILAHIGPAQEGKTEINEATDHWAGLNSSSLLEPIVRLYTLTGERRYLDFAAYIVERGGCGKGNIFELAYENRLSPYQYPVTKAYEMMSCFEGLLEYARVTENEKWLRAAERFARRVAATDVTLIGCCGCTHELFDHSAVRQLDPSEKGIMQETCVTVTWMKLCHQLLCLTGDAFFADEMERSAYNALLGALNTSYRRPHVSLPEGPFLPHGLPFDSYSPILPGTRGRMVGGLKLMKNGTYYGCCAAIGAAGPGLACTSAVMQAAQGPAVLNYEPGCAQCFGPDGQQVLIRVASGYPAAGHITLTLSPRHAETFSLFLRIPSWCASAAVSVNGRPFDFSPENGFCRIERLWQPEDSVVLDLPMPLRRIGPEAYGVPSRQAPFFALCRGPLVLALDESLGCPADLPLPENITQLAAVSAAPSEPFPPAFRIRAAAALEDRTAVLIDYASAGKDWESRIAAWLRNGAYGEA